MTFEDVSEDYRETGIAKSMGSEMDEENVCTYIHIYGVSRFYRERIRISFKDYRRSLDLKTDLLLYRNILSSTMFVDIFDDVRISIWTKIKLIFDSF